MKIPFLRRHPRTAFAIRCRSFDHDVEDLTSQIRRYFPRSRIYYIFDDREPSSSWNGPDGALALNIETLDSLGLFHQRENVAWVCGDYGYSLALQKPWDYLWLLEPDVQFANRSMELLTAADSTDTDLIGTKIAERPDSWGWKAKFRAVHDTERVYGVFFPLTRVSRALAEKVHEFRAGLTPLLLDNPALAVPNDESIVATTAVEGGFSTLDLYAEHPAEFKYWGWRPKYPKSLADSRSEPLIIHPSVADDDFRSYVRTELARLVTSQPVGRALELMDDEHRLEILSEYAATLKRPTDTA